MGAALITSPASLGHDPGPGHPESIARIIAVEQGLNGDIFHRLKRVIASSATKALLTLVHSERHVEAIFRNAPTQGRVAIDGDTVMSPGSLAAALDAAGALCQAVDLVMAGEADKVFCAVRPPGHHAEPDTAMGFCLFNNIAIGALHARHRYQISRIAVVDFDVHHGNGTEAAFRADENLFYTSTHQWPLYPGTGAASDRGLGNILNLPLEPGAGSDTFRHMVTTAMVPALERFAPELLLISAGFDAHTNDPLADLNLSTEDYYWVTKLLCDIAARHSAGRVISTLEGGYDLQALADSAAAHVKALMDAR